MTDGLFGFSPALVYFKKLSTARSAKLPDVRFRQSMTRLKMVPSTSFLKIQARHKTPMPSFCITSSEAGKRRRGAYSRSPSAVLTTLGNGATSQGEGLKTNRLLSHRRRN